MFIDGSLAAERSHGDVGNRNVIINIPLLGFVTIIGMKITGRFF